MDYCSLCDGENGSLGFVKRWFVCRVKPNVPFAGRHKIEFKKCAVGKIKNTEGSVPKAFGIGLLVVQLLYRFYVLGRWSKWFTFLFIFRSFVVARSSVTLAANGLV